MSASASPAEAGASAADASRKKNSASPVRASSPWSTHGVTLRRNTSQQAAHILRTETH